MVVWGNGWVRVGGLFGGNLSMICDDVYTNVSNATSTNRSTDHQKYVLNNGLWSSWLVGSIVDAPRLPKA